MPLVQNNVRHIFHCLRTAEDVLKRAVTRDDLNRMSPVVADMSEETFTTTIQYMCATGQIREVSPGWVISLGSGEVAQDQFVSISVSPTARDALHSDEAFQGRRRALVERGVAQEPYVSISVSSEARDALRQLKRSLGCDTLSETILLLGQARDEVPTEPQPQSVPAAERRYRLDGGLVVGAYDLLDLVCVGTSGPLYESHPVYPNTSVADTFVLYKARDAQRRMEVRLRASVNGDVLFDKLAFSLTEESVARLQ